jgi:hypothetical protein
MNSSNDISNEAKQAMITRYLDGQMDGQHALPRPTGDLKSDLLTWRKHVSPVAQFIEEDDDDWNRLMAGIDMMAFNRWRRPSYAEIARSAFPVQSLPQGALAVYDRDIDLSNLTYTPPLEDSPPE